MRRIVGLALGQAPAPDGTNIWRLRDRLGHLEAKGIKIATGMIVAATIISAPPSTKNQERSRVPDMHRTKKDNPWYCGAKGHIGVDSRTKVIHPVVTIAANVHDAVCLPHLLRDDDARVWGDLVD
ncbi:MAG: transposase [Gammaproteobacteria bacterium]